MESPALTARMFRLRATTDEAVATHALSGDPVAFAELHRRFHRRVEAFCRGRLDRQVAEDAAQETFLRVLRAVPQRIENAEAWILTIAGNVCNDLGRQATRRGEHLVASGFDLTGLPAADTAGELMRRENGRLVFLALRRLPTRYRTALVLREFHGMSSAEIAEGMGVSLGAVDPLVSRARAAFGSAYAEAGGFPEVCRVNVERVYRDLGPGLTEEERGSLDGHLAVCPRCREERRRALSARYRNALLPILAHSLPGLGVLNDAVVQAVSSPGVMHRLPLAASALATAAAIALAPAAVRVVRPPVMERPVASPIPASTSTVGTLKTVAEGTSARARRVTRQREAAAARAAAEAAAKAAATKAASDGHGTSADTADHTSTHHESGTSAPSTHDATRDTHPGTTGSPPVAGPSHDSGDSSEHAPEPGH